MVSGQAPNLLTSKDCGTFADFSSPSLDASGQETGEGCVYPNTVPTLMQQLDTAGLTWRGYMDSMGADPARESATCAHPTEGSPDPTEGGETASPYDEYATRHDPFVYFGYVIDDNQAECDADVVSLTPNLTTDLASVATTPNYVFITPDLATTATTRRAPRVRPAVGSRRPTRSCRSGCRSSPPHPRTSRTEC